MFSLSQRKRVPERNAEEEGVLSKNTIDEQQRASERIPAHTGPGRGLDPEVPRRPLSGFDAKAGGGIISPLTNFLLKICFIESLSTFSGCSRAFATAPSNPFI